MTKMDRGDKSSPSASSSPPSASSSPPESPPSRGLATVLSIECLKGSSKADEWTGDMLQTGDIVEELRIGTSVQIRSPFKNGKSGVQKVLHASFKSKDTFILVRVRRGLNEFAELQACIVPNESAGKKQYMLRSIEDPNYAVGFLDRSEAECLNLQGPCPCSVPLSSLLPLRRLRCTLLSCDSGLPFDFSSSPIPRGTTSRDWPYVWGPSISLCVPRSA